MMATAALDQTVTIWDTLNQLNETPKAKVNKDLKVGKLFTLNFYPSSPWLMGCGGGGKEIAIWDMTRDETIQKCFGDRTKASFDKPKDDLDKEHSKTAADAVMEDGSGKQVRETNFERKTSSSSSKKKKKKKKKAHRAGK